MENTAPNVSSFFPYGELPNEQSIFLDHSENSDFLNITD